MDDEDLLEIASKLEASFDYDNAQSRLLLAKPWMWLTGNRDSLLLFAVDFLRAAGTTIPENECRAAPVFLKHEQFCDLKTDQVHYAVQRIDQFPENNTVIAERRRRAWNNEAASLLACGFLGFTVIFLLISGIALWWHLITGTPLW